jgi:hypothetical protein
MTAKQYLLDKQLTGVEIIGDKIINLVVGKVVTGLDVDMTGIQFGIPVTRISQFIIDGDILKVNQIEVNLSHTKILG